MFQEALILADIQDSLHVVNEARQWHSILALHALACLSLSPASTQPSRGLHLGNFLLPAVN